MRSAASNLAQPLVPRGALLRAINTLRHLRYIFGDRRPAVLEVGPGSGYLGALLILEGYPYIATDVAEGFYLYQSQLWSSLANGGFVELACEDIKLSQINDLDPGTAAHVPWWRFFDLDYDKIAFGVEVVTCNHVLCEMHPRALLYLLKLAKHLIREGGSFRFLFEGWGYDVNMPAWWVNSRFYEHGFHICHNDEAITVFAPAGATEAVCHYPRIGLRNVQDPRIGLPNVQDAAAIRRLGEMKISRIWEPCFYATQSNPASARILTGRDEIARTVSAEQVAAFYDQLFPGWRTQYSDDRVFEILDVPG